MYPSQRFNPNHHVKFSHEFAEEEKGERRDFPTPAQTLFKERVENQNQNPVQEQVSAKSRKFIKQPSGSQKRPNLTVRKNLAFLKNLNADLEKLPFFKEKKILLTPINGLLDLSVFDVEIIPTKSKFRSHVMVSKNDVNHIERQNHSFEKEFLKRLRKPLHLNDKDFQLKIRELIAGIYLRVFFLEGINYEKKPKDFFLNECWKHATDIHLQFEGIENFYDLVKYLLGCPEKHGLEIAIAVSRKMINYEEIFSFFNFTPSMMVDLWLKERVDLFIRLGKEKDANFLLDHISDINILKDAQALVFKKNNEKACGFLTEFNKKQFQEFCSLIPKEITIRDLTFDPQTHNLQKHGSELIPYPKTPSLYFSPYSEAEELEMIEWEKAFLKRVRTNEINLNSLYFKEQFNDFASGACLRIAFAMGKIPVMPLKIALDTLQQLVNINDLKINPQKSNTKFFQLLASLIANDQIELAAAACRYLLNQYKIVCQENFSLASFKIDLSIDKFLEKIVFILIEKENFKKARIVIEWIEDETIKRPLIFQYEPFLNIQTILEDTSVMLTRDENYKLVFPDTLEKFWNHSFENYLWMDNNEKMQNLYTFESLFLKKSRDNPIKNNPEEKEIDYYSGIWLRHFLIDKEISKVKLNLISSNFFKTFNKSILLESFDRAYSVFSKLETFNYDDHNKFRKLLIELIKNDQLELAASTTKEIVYYDINKIFNLNPEKPFDAEAAINSLFAEAALPPKNCFEIERKDLEIERKEREPDFSPERNWYPFYEISDFHTKEKPCSLNKYGYANLAFINQLHATLKNIQELKYVNLSLKFEEDRLIFPDIIPTFFKYRSSCFPWKNFMNNLKAKKLESDFIKRIRKEPIFINDPNFQFKILDFYSGIWMRHCMVNNIVPILNINESNPVNIALKIAKECFSCDVEITYKHWIIQLIKKDQLELAAAMSVQWMKYKIIKKGNLDAVTIDLLYRDSEDEVDSFFAEAVLTYIKTIDNLETKVKAEKLFDYIKNENVKKKLATDFNLQIINSDNMAFALEADKALTFALELVCEMRQEKKTEKISGGIEISRIRQVNFLRNDKKLQMVLKHINIAMKNGIPDAPTYLFNDCKYGLLNAEEKLKLAIDSTLVGGFKTLIWYLNEKNPDIKKLTHELPKNGNFAHRIIFYVNLLKEKKLFNKKAMLTQFLKIFSDQNIENLKIEISNINENYPKRVIKIMNQLISKAAKADCTNNNVEMPLALLA